MIKTFNDIKSDITKQNDEAKNTVSRPTMKYCNKVLVGPTMSHSIPGGECS